MKLGSAIVWSGRHRRYRDAGRILGGRGLPTVLVHEGRYDLTTIGALVAETLAGVQEGATRA
jgi:hypothetical protein